MSSSTAPLKQNLATVRIAGITVALAVAAVAIYFNRPAAKPSEAQATAEAKAYLPNLDLSDVTMQASENFMKQQVVEVQGNIANKGPRTLRSVDVFCIFYSVDGREVYRERLAIVPPTGGGLKPNSSRHFRLPFDALPDGWNQAVPRMVIAQISFAG